MTIVALTMRIDHVKDRDEEHDGLDRRWLSFLQECGLFPLPLPNCLSSVDEILRRCDPSGVILTGGGSIAAIGGKQGEREAVEAFLLRWAHEHQKPVIGVCRGMQAILTTRGGKIVRVDGHVRRRHQLLPSGRTVNSFHEYAAVNVPRGFVVLQRSEDGMIEACADQSRRVLGIMWHPEREHPFDAQDKLQFVTHFGSNLP